MDHDSICTSLDVCMAAINRIVFARASDERFAAGDNHEVIRDLRLLADLYLVALVGD